MYVSSVKLFYNLDSLENLVCDECRKPAEISLEKESAIDESV